MQSTTFQDLKLAVADSWLIIERVPEKLDLKIDVFAELKKLARPDAILASTHPHTSLEK